MDEFEKFLGVSMISLAIILLSIILMAKVSNIIELNVLPEKYLYEFIKGYLK